MTNQSVGKNKNSVGDLPIHFNSIVHAHISNNSTLCKYLTKPFFTQHIQLGQLTRKSSTKNETWREWSQINKLKSHRASEIPNGKKCYKISARKMKFHFVDKVVYFVATALVKLTRLSTVLSRVRLPVILKRHFPASVGPATNFFVRYAALVLVTSFDWAFNASVSLTPTWVNKKVEQF